MQNRREFSRKKRTTSQASTSLKSTCCNYRLLLKYMQVDAFTARSVRLHDSTAVTITVFSVVRVCGALSNNRLHLLSWFASFSSQGIPTPELLHILPRPGRSEYSRRKWAGQAPPEAKCLTNLRKVESGDPALSPIAWSMRYHVLCGVLDGSIRLQRLERITFWK